MRRVIVNTTPLIALRHTGQLNLLKKMYGKIMIPQAVYRELSQKKESICKKQVDSSLDWIYVEEIENQMAKYLNLPVTGTLGVLIKAKRQGYINELKPIIQEMIDKNIYISEKLMRLCLEQVNEDFIE